MRWDGTSLLDMGLLSYLVGGVGVQHRQLSAGGRRGFLYHDAVSTCLPIVRAQP